METKRKAGRPKMAEKDKKIGFSMKVKPQLWKAIVRQTKGKNRNNELERALQKEFLQDISNP